MGLHGPPKYVLVDTATVAHIARVPDEPVAREIRSRLSSGDWVPVLTFQIVAEICAHANDAVVARRFELLRSLPHLAYIRTSEEKANVGCYIDLREREIQYLIQHPSAAPEEIVDAIRPIIFNGFVSGEQFYEENWEWWKLYRDHFAKHAHRRTAEIANIAHFHLEDPEEPLPLEGSIVTIRTKDHAKQKLIEMAEALAKTIAANGDVREISPTQVAERLMQESFEGFPFELGPQRLRIRFDDFLMSFGVRRDRLPTKATNADMGYEAIFVEQMKISARRLLINAEELFASVRRERLPSWTIWEGLDRTLTRMPRAEVGNLNDKHAAEFGAYVHLLNCDKRIAEAVRQNSSKHILFKRVLSNIPVGRGVAGLLSALKAS